MFRSLLASLLIVLRFVGILGVVRTIINLRGLGDLSSTPARDELHINYIAVAEHYRHRGVGAALMHYAKDEAHTQHKALISLDVRERNERGQRFFEAAGFQRDAIIASKSDAVFGQGARIRMVYEIPSVERPAQDASPAPLSSEASGDSTLV